MRPGRSVSLGLERDEGLTQTHVSQNLLRYSLTKNPSALFSVGEGVPIYQSP